MNCHDFAVLWDVGNESQLLTRGIVFKGVLSKIGLPMVKVYHEFNLGYVGVGRSVQ
jgi:hypothetical protein